MWTQLKCLLEEVQEDKSLSFFPLTALSAFSVILCRLQQADKSLDCSYSCVSVTNTIPQSWHSHFILLICFSSFVFSLHPLLIWLGWSSDHQRTDDLQLWGNVPVSTNHSFPVNVSLVTAPLMFQRRLREWAQCPCVSISRNQTQNTTISTTQTETVRFVSLRFP